MRTRQTIGMLLLLCGLAGAAAGPDASETARTERDAEPAIAIRMVQLPGTLDRPDLEDHLDRLAAMGFNAIWVQAHQLADSPLDDPPGFHDASRLMAAACAERDLRLFVSIAPMILGAERFALSDVELVDALRRFGRRLRRELRVSDLVLSFEGARENLSEIRDVMEYGREAAPAHADLAARLRAKLPKKVRLWFQPSGLLGGELPPSVGLVWTGSGNPSTRVEAVELDRLWAARGRRPTLLRDLYPANQSGPRMPLSHNLGPLRDRDAALATRLAGHVSVAMEDWGASRLTLMTVADWLRDPATYEAKPSWERAMKSLAGDDAEALEALRTQALEWGGPIGGLNHHTASTDNPAEVSRVLRDPALASRWKWTLARYPDRMAAISRLTDEAFRLELLEVMARRLAIAKAIPTTREIIARQNAGRGDLASLIAELNRVRSGATPRSARLAVDRFLGVAGLLPLLDRVEDAPSPRN